MPNPLKPHAAQASRPISAPVGAASRAVARAPEASRNGAPGMAGDSLQLDPGRQRNSARPPAESVPSPNYESRNGTDIDTIILHNTRTTGTAREVAAKFQDQATEYASHYVIGKDGAIVQSVNDDQSAKHAQGSVFKGDLELNDQSIGISLVNLGNGNDPFSDQQYVSLAKLVMHLEEEYGVPGDRLVAAQTFTKDSRFSLQRLNEEKEKLKAPVEQPRVLVSIFGKDVTFGTEKVAPPKTQAYTTQEGDTLPDMAEIFGTTVEELKKLNPDLKGDVLEPGTTVFVPAREVTEKSRDYEVQQGDTLKSIANEFGTTAGDLMRRNNLQSNDVAPGQVIKVPDTGEAVKAPAPAPEPEPAPAPAPPAPPPAAPAPAPPAAPKSLHDRREEWFFSQFAGKYNPNEDVPGYDNANCGPAAITMAAKAFGKINPTVEQADEAIEETRRRQKENASERKGSSLVGIRRAAQSYGLNAEIINNVNLAKIEAELAKGNLVVAHVRPNYIFPNSTNGHFTVVTAIKDGQVYLNDSANKDGPMTLDVRSFMDSIARRGSFAMLSVKG